MPGASARRGGPPPRPRPRAGAAVSTLVGLLSVPQATPSEPRVHSESVTPGTSGEVCCLPRAEPAQSGTPAGWCAVAPGQRALRGLGTTCRSSLELLLGRRGPASPRVLCVRSRMNLPLSSTSCLGFSEHCLLPARTRHPRPRGPRRCGLRRPALAVSSVSVRWPLPWAPRDLGGSARPRKPWDRAGKGRQRPGQAPSRWAG